jgi:hypothetical protein
MSERYKKTLIDPKVRLLLSIYLQGFPNRTSWRKKLEKELDYDKSNLSNHLTELFDDKLIESVNHNGKSPPYKITKEGKRFLKPIIFPFQIGLFIISWVALWFVVFYLLFNSQPIVMASAFLVFILFSFVSVALILIFQPYVLLKAGKISY